MFIDLTALDGGNAREVSVSVMMIEAMIRRDQTAERKAYTEIIVRSDRVKVVEDVAEIKARCADAMAGMAVHSYLALKEVQR